MQPEARGRTRRHLLPIAAGAAVVTAAGCATAPASEHAAFVMLPPLPVHVTPVDACPVHGDAPCEPAPTAAAVDPDAVAVAAAPAVDPLDAPVRFSAPPDDTVEAGRPVGLWGTELVDDDAVVASPIDESGNVQQITFATAGTTFDPDASPDGTHVVFASTRHRPTADIYLQSIPGTSVTQLTADPGHDIMPALDPTGTRVAFASDRGGNWDVYVVPVEGGRPVQVTTDPEHELHPTWSPDGAMLAYCRFGARSGRWEIWTIDVDRPTAPRFLTYGVFPQWSPATGAPRLLFQRARERGSRLYSIWTVDLVDGEARRPTEILDAANAALINPAWSPDGRRIAFVSVVEPDAQDDPPRRSDVWVADLDGSRRINLTRGHTANYQPVWAGDDRILFVSDRSGVDNVWSVQIDPPATTRPADESGFVIVGPQAMPGERP